MRMSCILHANHVMVMSFHHKIAFSRNLTTRLNTAHEWGRTLGTPHALWNMSNKK